MVHALRGFAPTLRDVAEQTVHITAVRETEGDVDRQPCVTLKVPPWMTYVCSLRKTSQTSRVPPK